MFAMYLNNLGDHFFFDMNNSASSSPGNDNLIVLNNKGTILKSMSPFSVNLNYGTNESGFLIKNNDGLLFNSAYNGTLFQLTTGSIYPKYIFNFGAQKIPRDVQTPRQRFVAKSLSYSYLGSHVVESKNILMFTYFLKRSFVYAFCNKNDVERASGNQAKTLIPHVLHFLMGHPLGITDSNQFISSIGIPQLMIILYRKSELSTRIKIDYPDFYNIFSSLDKSANPVLVLFKFKADR